MLRCRLYRNRLENNSIPVRFRWTSLRMNALAMLGWTVALYVCSRYREGACRRGRTTLHFIVHALYAPYAPSASFLLAAATHAHEMRRRATDMSKKHDSNVTSAQQNAAVRLNCCVQTEPGDPQPKRAHALQRHAPPDWQICARLCTNARAR